VSDALRRDGAGAPAAPPPSAAPDSTILIVDDEPAGREVLHALLVDQGYHLALASNGAEALAAAVELTPDLVILDVMMPAMDGYEVCQRLRAHPTLSQVPVIMVTALDDRGSRLRGIEAGADDFVSKPFDRLELRTRVKTIMRLNRFRRLLSEHARFEWVVENAADGYLILDRGDRVLYANSLARRYLDLPEQGSLPSDGFRALAERRYRLTPEDAWRPENARVPDASGTPVYLVRPESEGDQSLWLQVERFSMAAHAGDSVLVRLRDVTSNVVMQRDFWTYHALIRHKLATPVTKLNLALSLLADPKGTERDADRRTLFAMAEVGARELGEEIERIFEYMAALDQRGHGQEGSTLADVERSVAHICESLRIGAPNLAYVGIAKPGETRLVMSRHALEMVLWEILENAKKFHPEHAPSVDIDVAAREDGVHVRVADDGRTISPEELDKVWLPYFQAERYFTGQVPGMGLGLSTVATLVWSVGGSCRLRNRDDVAGVAVEIVIPSFAAAGAPSKARARRPSAQDEPATAC